nr:hypothetical protein HK105_007960 [Polyrhizophydium stewartii]
MTSGPLNTPSPVSTTSAKAAAAEPGSPLSRPEVSEAWNTASRTYSSFGEFAMGFAEAAVRLSPLPALAAAQAAEPGSTSSSSDAGGSGKGDGDAGVRRKPLRVMDIACGLGAASIAAARELAAHGCGSQDEAVVLATDLSPEMVAGCAAAAKAAGIGALLDCKAMDGQRLAVETGTQDMVFCQFGIIFFADRVRGAREIRRVLKSPGGVAVILTWERVRTAEIAIETVRETCPSAARTPEQVGMGNVLSLNTPEKLTELLTSVGFTRVDIHRRRDWFGMTFEEYTDFTANPIIKSLFEEYDIVEGSPQHAAVMEGLRHRLNMADPDGSGVARLEMVALIAVAYV